MYQRMHEIVDAIRCCINAILRHECERFIRGRYEVPVKLHLDAAGPFYDSIHADRILEWFDNNAGAGRSSRCNCLVHIGDQVPAKRRNEAGDEGIEIAWRNIHMSRVVLRPDRDVRGQPALTNSHAYGAAGTKRMRVISEGTPKRFGGPQ
jgi:hypothetical protein